jgi:hypothetical protein
LDELFQVIPLNLSPSWDNISGDCLHPLNTQRPFSYSIYLVRISIRKASWLMRSNEIQ